MLGANVIATVNQKVLSFLAKFSDKEYYEREVARKLGVAYGSANRALNELYADGALKRRQAGKMYFYSIADASSATVIEYKKLVNLFLLEPLTEELKSVASRVILYSSCAQGTDNSASDVDLFVVTNNPHAAADVINGFVMPNGFEGIRIQPVIKTPVELLQAGESERTFLDEVERGIVLWERSAVESRV